MRPRRTSYTAMIDMADRLENERKAHLTASLLREAAEV
ncbi:hypothetical protein D1BOALGB6SA_7499 [Olavius sp. associated proteobacterium Delta 1]|nr:hypothetical protein D1BOALGB6SA_7499 [Olavius sp. associated proteobacterium Delta 1]